MQNLRQKIRDNPSQRVKVKGKYRLKRKQKPRKKISKGKKKEKVIGCSRLKDPVKSSKPIKADFNTDIPDENVHNKIASFYGKL